MLRFEDGPARLNSRRGFTLVELLVVILVVGLIVSAVAPMVFSTLSSTRLTSAGETMAAQISLAKQIATSKNEGVEVRFYSYEDPEVPGSTEQVRAMALMRVSPSASIDTTGSIMMEALTPVYYLPSGIVISKSTVMSPLLSGGTLREEKDSEKVIKRSSRAKYRAFRFTADGSPNLEVLMSKGRSENSYEPSKSYITLIEERPKTTDDVPKNFYTLQIDPATGKTSSYRP